MIRRARLDAATWQQRYFERRDSALLHLIGHSRANRRNIENFTVADLSYRGDGRWVVPEFSLRRIRRTVMVDQTSKAHICAPCAWIRWLEVHVVLQDKGIDGLIEVLSLEDPASDHVCLTTAIDTSSLDGSRLLFQAGHPRNLQQQPLTGTTANAVFNKRLKQGRISVISTSRYGLMSVHAAVEDARDQESERRRRGRADQGNFFTGFS